MSSVDLRNYFIEKLQVFLAKHTNDGLALHQPGSEYLFKTGQGTHFHHTPEFFVQFEGATLFEGHDYSFTLKSGEVAVVQRGLPHAETAWHGRAAEFSGLVCCFRHNEVCFLKSYCGEGGVPQVDSGIVIRTEASQRIVGHLDEMTQASRLASDYACQQHHALLTVTLSALLNLLMQDRDMDRSHAVSRRVAFCKSRVSERLEDPEFTVQVLAKELNCSADYLNRQFKAETASSLNKYLRQERIQYAITNMSHPHLNLSQIAQLSGFSSLNYFSRAFKQATGITPMEYRKSRAHV